MPKCLVFCIVLVLLSVQAAAQQTSGERKNSVFAGFSFNSAEVNSLTITPGRAQQHGVNGQFLRSVRPNLHLVADVSAHFASDEVVFAARPYQRNRDQYAVLGGVQYSFAGSSAATPFVRALVGVAIFRGFAATTSAPNVFFIDEANGFATALGGGVDLRRQHLLGIRLFQVDFAPTHFASGWQKDVRVATGLMLNW